MTSELIERVARAIADTTDFDGDRIASRYADSELRDIAQSAITAVIEADREAVRAEQAAELAKWRDKYNELGQMALEQVSDLGTKLGSLDVELDASKADLQAANRELAKYKALAETLAGALEAIRSEAQREEGSWLHLKRCIAAQSAEALREYKEATNV